MIEKSISYIANYLWQKSMENIEIVLTAEEKNKFNIADYYYLTTIYHMNRPNFGEVSEKLGLTKPAVSALVKRLKAIGFLEKQQSSEDRRIFYLDPTEKGRSIIEGDISLYLQFTDVIRSLITQEQFELVDCLLEQVVTILKNNTNAVTEQSISGGNDDEQKI